MRLTRQDQFAVAIVAVLAALAALVFLFGKTGPLPVHFGLNGQANRWGDRTEVALWALANAAFAGLIYALMPALARPRAAQAATASSVPIARLIMLAVAMLIGLLSAAIGFGFMTGGGSTLSLVMATVSALLLAMGAYLGKVEPNPFVGVRTYWSLRSRLAWDKSNRLFGRIAFWMGLAGLAAFPLAPQPLGLQAMIAVLLFAVAAAVFESWRVWRDDPDRRTA